MTGSFSNYAENKVLDHIMGKNEFTMPTTVYIALCTSTPTDASTGTTIVEPSTSGTDYARIEIPDTSLNNATSGAITNSTTITFPIATDNWGTITHFAIVDSETVGEGNVLLWGEVSPNVPVPDGSIVLFSAGNLQVNLD